MKKHLFSTMLLVTASLMMTIPADAAKRKKAPASAKSYADTYYYSGTGTHSLRDRSRAYFGSPVRGVEFFEATQSPHG